MKRIWALRGILVATSLAAATVALTTGILFALLPAGRAARLEPVAALAGR